MDKEIKRQALRQYLRYFRIWFIIVGITVAVTSVVLIAQTVSARLPRGNRNADEGRVYDYADVLTDSEEQTLRDKIAEYEQKSHVDIVIVTLREPMGKDDSDWEWNMMNYADDFYDNGNYGWNKAHGDGALLLDNWYEDADGSQKGSWLSTSGKMEEIIGIWEEDKVLDDMYEYIDRNPYRAYLAAAKRLADFGRYGAGDRGYGTTPGEWVSVFFGVSVISFMVALFYLLSHLMPTMGKDTTSAGTYVEGGVPVVRLRTDDFIRKSVTSRRIESSSSGGGGGGSSHRGGGSYGSHTSSGGHSHGGGGRRR
ncbi:MAG: TPM domain-containing protein [Muribaculum sp.]|nr:TPM domain-containing protein [Muribaculum sp.]